MKTNLPTTEAQRALAQYCKTGKDAPETSLPKHTKYYRELITNSVKSIMKSTFPLSRGLVGKKRWKKMLRIFFETHPCQTPYYWQLPLEFYNFYQTNPLPFKKPFPCLLELLHYEWLETEMFLMEDLPAPAYKKKGSLAKDALVPNPEIKILGLQYPVHLKEAGKIGEEDKGQYFAVIARNPDTKELSFNDLAYPFVELLLQAHEQASRVADLATFYAKHEPDKKIAQTKVKEFVQFALKNGLFLGFHS